MPPFPLEGIRRSGGVPVAPTMDWAIAGRAAPVKRNHKRDTLSFQQFKREEVAVSTTGVREIFFFTPSHFNQAVVPTGNQEQHQQLD